MAWVVIVLLVAFAIGYWLWINSKKSINWQEHYSSVSKDPYGTYLLKELIKFKYENHVVDITKSISEDLPVDSIHSSYIFIGPGFELSDAEQKSLFAYIEKGNNAFIATKYLPYSIRYLLKNGGKLSFDSSSHAVTYMDSVVVIPIADTIVMTQEELIELEDDGEEEYDEENNYTYSEDSSSIDPGIAYADSTTSVDTIYSSDNESATIHEDGIESATVLNNSIKTKLLRPLPHAKKTYTFKIHEPTNSLIQNIKPYEWNGISMQTAMDSSCIGLSTMHDSLYNFIRIPYGKGSIYVFTSPLLLTNYFMKEKDGLSHAEEILSVLSNEHIYWDEVPSNDRNSENKANHHAQTTLRYILSNESLRWAWYLLLASVIVYIVFESKRKQRIIPVVEPINNTSIEYVQTTGRLYAQIGNHRKLIQLNMKLFLSTIQQKYGIKPDLENPVSIEWLSVKTGISKERFEELQKEFKRVTVPGHELKTKDLHTFYQRMQFIYKKLQN